MATPSDLVTPSEKYYESLLVTSNLVFIWPIVEAVLAGEYYVAIMLFFTMVASTFYHICGLVQQCSIQFGGRPRTLDFIFATNVICLTILYWSGLTNLNEMKKLGYSTAKYAEAVVYSLTLFVVCIVAVLFGNFDSYVYMTVILASFGVLFMRFVIFAPEDASDDRAVRGIYRIEYFIMTALLGLIGILLFFADDWINFPAYDETHPFWHILIGATIGLAIRGVRYREQYDALRQRDSIQKRQVADGSNVGDAGLFYDTIFGRHSKDDDGTNEDGLF
jgi:hypothetical protein